MQVKKAAYDAVIAKLESELAAIQSKVRQNKSTLRVFEGEQARLKRERGILTELIGAVKANQKKDAKE